MNESSADASSPVRADRLVEVDSQDADRPVVFPAESTSVARLRERLQYLIELLSEPPHIDQSTTLFLETKVDELEAALPATVEKLYADRDEPPPVTPTEPPASAEEAELLIRMDKIVKELRFRCEDFQHVHDISVLKIERAGQRILALESDVARLEADLLDDQTELSYLKLQLKAIEAQASPYLSTADEELAAGIQRWKLDWAEANHRFNARNNTNRSTAPPNGNAVDG